MPIWLSLIASIISAFIAKLFEAIGLKRKDEDRAAAHERAGAAEAGNETLETITEIADARANLPDPFDDPDALAGELRGRRKMAGGRRNLIYPGQGDTGGTSG